MKVCLFGRGGKVGRVLAPALEAAGHELVELDDAEAAIDFTAPDAVVPNVLARARRRSPVRDRHERRGLDEVDERARERGLPVFFAPNFAIGAVLMMRLAAEASTSCRAPRSSSCTTRRRRTRRPAPRARQRTCCPATRRSTPCGCRARRASGGAARRRGPAADDPARRVLARGLRPGRAAGAREAARAPPGLTVGLDALL